MLFSSPWIDERSRAITGTSILGRAHERPSLGAEGAGEGGSTPHLYFQSMSLADVRVKQNTMVIPH